MSCALGTYLKRQRAWSIKTFGAGLRTIGICRHIEKELREIQADPSDLNEWIDMIILGMDGFWRHGGSDDELFVRLRAKQAINFARRWPAPQPEDHATEHIR